MSSKIKIQTKVRGRKPLNLNEEERKQRRTIQNRINKRNERLRKKIMEGVSPLLSKPEKDKLYFENLINYFEPIEFNIHFTGTFNPKSAKKISLQSLKSYTDKFIQSLIKEKIIESGLVFLDIGKNENTHTHILFKTNTNNKNVLNKIKSKWLLGKNIDCRIIETELHKLNIIKYGFKKILNNFEYINKNYWNLIKL